MLINRLLKAPQNFAILIELNYQKHRRFKLNKLHLFLSDNYKMGRIQKSDFGPKIINQKFQNSPRNFSKNFGTKHTSSPSRTSGCIKKHFRFLAKTKIKMNEKI